MARKSLMLKGTQFLFTTQAGHIDVDGSLSALPTSFPASTKNLVDGTVGVPGNEWVNFKCVRSTTPPGAVTPEMVEHRCIADSKRVVEQQQTGYDIPEPIEMDLDFYQEEYVFFLNLMRTEGYFRLLYVLKLRSDHDGDPAHGAMVVKVASCNKSFDTGGQPIGLRLRLMQVTDEVFVSGADA